MGDIAQSEWDDLMKRLKNWDGRSSKVFGDYGGSYNSSTSGFQEFNSDIDALAQGMYYSGIFDGVVGVQPTITLQQHITMVVIAYWERIGIGMEIG